MERIAEFVVHGFGAVTDDVETAAFLRALEAERGDDNMPAEFERMQNTFDIFAAVSRIGKKMKDGAVMPDIVMTFGEFDAGNVGFDPGDVFRFASQAVFTAGDRLSGNIQNCNVRITVFQKIIDQRGIAAADIYDRRISSYACIGYHPKGRVEVFAKPTYLITTLGLIDIFPMRLSIHISENGCRSSKGSTGTLSLRYNVSPRAAASALSSGRVLKAIAAAGAALRIVWMMVSNNARCRGGSRTPAPITTQS